MTYGRDGFKKDRGGIAYHIEMDIAGGACGIEAGDWDGKTVPAVARPCYEDFADDGRYLCRQTVRGGDGHVDAEVLQGICKGQEAEKDACLSGQTDKIAP